MYRPISNEELVQLGKDYENGVSTNEIAFKLIAKGVGSEKGSMLTSSCVSKMAHKMGLPKRAYRSTFKKNKPVPAAKSQVISGSLVEKLNAINESNLSTAQKEKSIQFILNNK